MVGYEYGTYCVLPTRRACILKSKVHPSTRFRRSSTEFLHQRSQEKSRCPCVVLLARFLVSQRLHTSAWGLAAVRSQLNLEYHHLISYCGAICAAFINFLLGLDGYLKHLRLRQDDKYGGEQHCACSRRRGRDASSSSDRRGWQHRYGER
jgi:hypothetical protein